MSDVAHHARQDNRKRGLTILGGVVLLGGLAYGAYWFMFMRNFISTDDAYISGDVVAITSREPAVVVAVHGDNTQSVNKGQVLVELDPLKANVDLQAAEAALARTVRGVRAKFARVDQLRAQLAATEVTLAQAQSDLKRRTAIADLVSQEEIIHARDAVTAAEATQRAMQSGISQALAEVEGTRVADNPEVLSAIAALRNAAIVRGHMELTAPLSGVIAQRTVQAGQQIATGTPLMAVVPVDGMWVDANFKEVQLRDLRLGQPVTVRADVYGDDVTYHAKIAGFGAGTGAAFALLPAQNASGNWIKIVQRVPVRISLDPAELRAHPLRIGLSAAVNVDVREKSGTTLGVPATVREIRADAGDGGGPETDQLIARILQANGA